MVTRRERTQGGERTDRGQLILIAAILLAVVVVSSVLLLNTAQSRTDLRTSQQSQSIADAEQTSQELRDGLETLFETNASLVEADAKLPYSLGLEPGVETVQASYLNHTSTNATALVSVSYDEADSVTGGIVFQTESSSFASKGGDSGWTVLADVTSVPKLSAEIDNLEANPDFRIELDGSNSEQLTIEENGVGRYKVSRTADGATRECAELELPIVLDFEGGAGEIRSAGAVCEDMTFGTTLSGEFDIVLDNGDKADGTYTISGGGDAEVDDSGDFNVYDSEYPTGDEPNYRGPDDSSGTGDDVVVNPAFEVAYDDSDITYRSEYGLYNRTGR